MSPVTPFRLWALGIVLLAAGSSAAVEPPPRPGDRAPGLQYFRLDPATPDTTWRVLAVPVQFPGDPPLPADLASRIAGTDRGSLFDYWGRATGGRLRVEVTVAPARTARGARFFYTAAGEENRGYGLDPEAYPHNARRLVEEVTAGLESAIDLRRFDNTGDGILDALLIVHSGPRAREAPDPPPAPSVLLPHAFTLTRLLPRGDVAVFPYAVASARDSIGTWAHETGHLLGLPDLYVSTALGASPGIGEWSLMATGSHRGDGGDPTGLDPFSRQLLGFEPVRASSGTVDLAGGVFLRTFRPGEVAGPEYFLVERRTGEDGLGLETEATVVYHVDETAIDNRNFFQRLVEVRAVLCEGAAGCDRLLDDDTIPSLRDGGGGSTGLRLRVTGREARVEALLPGGSPVALTRVRLGEASGSAQSLTLEWTNLDPERDVSLTAETEIPGEGFRTVRRGGGSPVLVPAGSTVAEPGWAVEREEGSEPPEGVVTMVVRWGEGSFSEEASHVLRLGTPGTGDEDPAGMTWSPVRFWDTGSGSAFLATKDLEPRAEATLLGPWVTVPVSGRAVLHHGWSIEALAPDAALDGLVVEVLPQGRSPEALQPPGGWGYTAERGTGNALGGQPVLAGTGSRVHVLDLGPWAGETVRLRARLNTWVGTADTRWEVDLLQVTGPPGVDLALSGTGSEVRIETPAPTVSASIWVYGGGGVGTPAQELLRVPAFHPVPPKVPTDELPPGRRRVELVWLDDAGRGGSQLLTLEEPVPITSFLAPPFPNPLPRGASQVWELHRTPEDPPGPVTFRMVDVTGRRVVERVVRFDDPGRRRWTWDGLDDSGRRPAAGVYFLQCRRPDGTRASHRLVLLP